MHISPLRVHFRHDWRIRVHSSLHASILLCICVGNIAQVNSSLLWLSFLFPASEMMRANDGGRGIYVRTWAVFLDLDDF